jgi:diacylglycerol kinase (ATP)
VRAYTFVVNPHSAGGAGAATAAPVARLLRDAGAPVELVHSTGVEATADVVTGAVARGDVVVAVGGDGMVSSVAGRIAELGGTLGLVPAGRGNDFCRMLEVPHDPAALVDMLLEGPVVPVDLLRVDVPGSPSRVVAGSAYAGVDAKAAEIVDSVQWLPGRLQYPWAAVRALATYAPADLRLVVDGEALDYTAAQVCVANSAYYGKGMQIAPGASVTDGMLDAVVIEATSRLKLIRSLPKVYDGAHVSEDGVHVLRGRRFELTATPRRGTRLPIGGDGEPLGRVPEVGEEPVVVEAMPGALSVLLPRA